MSVKYKDIFVSSFFIFFLFCSTTLCADHEESHMTQSGPLSEPEFKIIDKWRGTWDVKVIRHQPKPAIEVTYVETFEWILNGRFLQSNTSRKPEGNKSMSVIWFDVLTKNYRFVIFDSMGIMLELPPPTWSENTQTMEWESSLFSPVSFTGYTTFVDQDTIRWKSLLKDWKGTIILDLEGTSTRRK